MVGSIRRYRTHGYGSANKLQIQVSNCCLMLFVVSADLGADITLTVLRAERRGIRASEKEKEPVSLKAHSWSLKHSKEAENMTSVPDQIYVSTAE